MSLKSLIYSILAVLLFCGLLAFTLFFLFGIDIIVGIVGIVITLVIPPIFARKAISSANGMLDNLIAKVIVPVLMLVILAAILLIFFFAL